jgi:hypothetical protein
MVARTIEGLHLEVNENATSSQTHVDPAKSPPGRVAMRNTFRSAGRGY